MVALRAWYDPDDDNEPVIVRTIDDVDAFLDRLAADRAAGPVPPLMQLTRRDVDGWAVLHIGVDGERGILTHTGPTGSYITTNGEAAADKPLVYDYMGHVREVPDNAGVPVSRVREAVHEFVATNGERPTAVEWQLAE